MNARVFFMLCALPGVVLAAGEPVTVEVGKAQVTVSEKGKTALIYRYGEVPFKPYASECYTPEGVQFLRDSPADHKHHHALMYAIGLNGISFWEETDKGGKQLHKEFSPVKTEAVKNGTWTHWGELLDWVPPRADKPLAAELRILGVLQLKSVKARLITWETQLTPARGAGDLQLTGSHYYGLGARFIETMDKNGKFLYSSGRPGDIVRGDERNTPGTWCAYRGMANGKPVTIAMFDYPENFRAPATWFTMGDNGGHFAYLGATHNLYKEPGTLKQNETLRVRYGVAFYDGHVPEKQIKKDYRAWKKVLAKQ